MQSGDITEACKLLYKYQHLISKSPAPNLVLQVKDDKIETYIGANYFQLIGVCKNVSNYYDELSPWLSLPTDIMTEVLSYLWPHSLSPQLFPKTEEEILEPRFHPLPYKTDTLGNICTDSA
jgi:hypothetical protein